MVVLFQKSLYNDSSFFFFFPPDLHSLLSPIARTLRSTPTHALTNAHTHTLKQNQMRTHRWPQSLPHCQYNYCTQLFWWIFHYVCISCLAGAFRGSGSQFRWETHNYILLLREATALCPLLNSINEGNNISYGIPSETRLLNYEYMPVCVCLSMCVYFSTSTETNIAAWGGC